MAGTIELPLHPQQGTALLTEANEILYGGAAGGGKSHLMRVAAIDLCSQVKGLQVYLFRRLSDDLYKNHMEGAGGFFALLEDWFRVGLVKYDGSKNVLKFWNGSKIWLCHCQHEKDRFKYQGVEIHVLLIDELTHFSEVIYRYLRGRCRIGGLVVPAHIKHKLPLILTGSNPGGVGHTWAKRTFVDRGLGVNQMDAEEGGMRRQFIPARLKDNPTLMENDPNYVNALKGLGNPILVKAMLEGDWDIVAGGAIDDIWQRKVHVIPLFKIPREWTIYRTFDWGSAHPFSVGWFAKANGEEAMLPSGVTFCPPPNTLIRFAEWYGTKALGSNEGIRLGSVDIARGIIKRESDFLKEGIIEADVHAGPADNQIYAVADEDTESIAKKMSAEGVDFIRSDKSAGSRVNGLEMFRARLKASVENVGAGIYFTSNCTAAIATLPVLPRDEKKIEDVDTNSEDHIYDEVRYMCLNEPIEYAKEINIGYSY